MYCREIAIGKIIKIESLLILIEVFENDIVDKITINMDVSDFLISINNLIYSMLPNGKKAIAKVTKIYDKSTFVDNNIFIESKAKYIVEAKLVGIYDECTRKFDNGINSFPIIGSEVYPLKTDVYKSVYDVDSDYVLEIGKCYHNEDIFVYADPDVLLGKHLGIFGNTGTGKTCTVVSIIQGLKRRLKSYRDDVINIKPKIIIFDANDEYEKAFDKDKFKVKIIRKEELKLPHYYLSYTEYYKLVGASQGVQAPTLKAAIENLRGKKNSRLGFSFKELPDAIDLYIEEICESNYTKQQWYNWNSTMINRIQRIIEDERLISIIDPQNDENTVDDVIQSDEEIIIIQADFDRDEIDIIMFLFCKLIYRKIIENYGTDQQKSILLLFEEAHRYINESYNEEYKLGNYYIERLAREGRKFGISLIISSQRPSELSTTVLSQCNSFIIHRITNRNDLDFISKVLRTSNQELIYLIPGLEKQYAVVIGEAFGYSDIVKIHDAYPLPKSNDPKVINTWKDGSSLSNEEQIKYMEEAAILSG